MTDRNSHGEGSRPRQRSDGRWEIKLSLGSDGQGQRIRRSVYGKTRRACQQAARQLLKDHEDGKLTNPSSLTVADYLGEWLEHKAFEVEPRTLENYRKDAGRYLLPHLKDTRLQKLSVPLIKGWQRELAKGHGAYTANRAKALLGNMLGDAIDEGLLAFNAAERVKGLRHKKKQIEIWTADEIEKALEAARPTRWYALVYLALATGMRHGELTGLFRNKVTFYPDSQLGANDDHGEIRVDTAVVTVGGRHQLGTPKSDAGTRTLGFSRETKGVLLEHYRNLELEEQQTELVFPTRNGSFIEGNNTKAALDRIIISANPHIREWLRQRAKGLRAQSLSKSAAYGKARKELEGQDDLLARLEVHWLTFHDLRHTFASMMIAEGVDPVRLARLLGHSDPSITMRTYAHFFEKQKRPAIPSLSKLTGKAIGGQIGGQSDFSAEDENGKDAA